MSLQPYFGRIALITLAACVALAGLSYFTHHHHHQSSDVNGIGDSEDLSGSYRSASYTRLLKHIRENVLIPPPMAAGRRNPKANNYHSQLGQDKLANKIVFKNKTNGFFIEAGAYNGVDLSNTLYFEETFNWTGLLVEPDPVMFQKVKEAKRNAWLLHGCLGSHRSKTQSLTLNTNAQTGGAALAYISEMGNKHRLWKQYVKNDTAIEVTCYPLNLLLDAIGCRHVDYFSLDVEGAEAAVIHSIDYDRYSFGLIDYECNNCVDGTGKWTGVAGQDMLEKRNYIKKHLEFEGYEETFYRDQDIFYVPRAK